eukprot:3765628-Amphidinium_carterae.1
MHQSHCAVMRSCAAWLSLQSRAVIDPCSMRPARGLAPSQAKVQETQQILSQRWGWKLTWRVTPRRSLLGNLWHIHLVASRCNGQQKQCWPKRISGLCRLLQQHPRRGRARAREEMLSVLGLDMQLLVACMQYGVAYQQLGQQ